MIAEAQTWETFQELHAEVIMERKEKALEVSRGWENKSDTIWTDGSRLDSKAVGAAIAFKREGAWRERGFYLGRNKEIFDAEIFAILQAVRTLEERGEGSQQYTVFSDSQAALGRIQCDRTGAGQALAIEVIHTVRTIVGRGNGITFRWTPSHEGVEGNEQADKAAKRAALDELERATPQYLSEASLSYLRRVVTESRSIATAEWIRSHTGRQRRYRPPKAGKMRKALNGSRKEIASRFYQLLSGHAATADHLRRIGQADSDECFWCGTGERQTRFHLFVRCRRWAPEIKKLWKRVREGAGGRGGAPSIRRLFGNEGNSEAILEFLEGTKVRKMPSRVLLAGGPDLEEEDLEVFSLLAMEEEAEDSVSEEEEEVNPLL